MHGETENRMKGMGKASGAWAVLKGGGGRISFIRKLRFQQRLEGGRESGTWDAPSRQREPLWAGSWEGAWPPCSRNRTAWRPLAGVEGVSGRG